MQNTMNATTAEKVHKGEKDMPRYTKKLCETVTENYARVLGRPYGKRVKGAIDVDTGGGYAMIVYMNDSGGRHYVNHTPLGAKEYCTAVNMMIEALHMAKGDL